MTIKVISPKDFDEKLQNNEPIFLLDVRAEEKYNDYHIENPNIENQNIPKNIIFDLDKNGEEELQSLPKNSDIVITCTTGNSARKCAEILSKKDYQVTLLDGGITAWKQYTDTKHKD
ncbi:rhodanese-like domain-containing protein [Neobacillus sp. SuZ13]|uniref:rhodanese-like domain-containing protein n=1 Tax=Neobacillus sp. SuZ13 TaxID=3047875 RepID=UPI0024C04DEA|nr:rhodanese-like domain-containing protein [Neobacillus sp. SuZ13]WHY69757.1 rhodanese-like domain-containing protein [Neobacillus sp. SuZ13]